MISVLWGVFLMEKWFGLRDMLFVQGKYDLYYECYALFAGRSQWPFVRYVDMHLEIQLDLLVGDQIVAWGRGAPLKGVSLQSFLLTNIATNRMVGILVSFWDGLFSVAKS